MSRERGRRKRPHSTSSRSLVVRWTARAHRDLIDIGDYIAADNPTAAERWLETLVQAANDAAFLPLAGRVVPEFGRNEIRETFRGRYRLVYRVLADAIEILTVFEGHRQLPGEVLSDLPSE